MPRGYEHHQAAPRRAFGDLTKNGVHIGLLPWLLNGQGIDDAENVVVFRAHRNVDTDPLVERDAADAILLPQN